MNLLLSQRKYNIGSLRYFAMNPIDKIKELMKRYKSIEDFINALGKEEFSAIYMRQADESLKKELGINPDEIWHRFWIETSVTPVNKWENVTNYTTVLISDDFLEIKVLDNK